MKKEEDFKLIENGKFNSNYPVRYNLLLGYVNLNKMNYKRPKYLPHITKFK